MNMKNSIFTQISKMLYQIVRKITSFNLKIISGLLVQKKEIKKSGGTEGRFCYLFPGGSRAWVKMEQPKHVIRWVKHCP